MQSFHVFYKIPSDISIYLSVGMLYVSDLFHHSGMYFLGLELQLCSCKKIGHLWAMYVTTVVHMARASLMEGGIAPVETSRTQGLENTGLVGLQRQIMRGMRLSLSLLLKH